MQGVATESLMFFLGLVTVAIAFIGVVFLANRLLAPSSPNPGKLEPFECGLDQAGQPWAASRMRFSTIAMLFVLFDAEAILLFAVASRLRGSWIAMLEVGVFVAFLAFGLMYAWKKGALEWRS